MNTTKESIDLTDKSDFSIELADESSFNPNNVGFSELDISETTQNDEILTNTNVKEQSSTAAKTRQYSDVNGKKCSQSHIDSELTGGSTIDVSLVSVDDENEEADKGKTTGEIQQDELTEITEYEVQDTAEIKAKDEEAHSLDPNERNLFQYPLVELGRRLWESNAKVQHYTKGCVWSPDGTCLLVPVHLDGMHIVEIPLDLYQAKSIALNRKVNGLHSAVHVKEGGTVYDYDWYPHMNSQMPETCCWIASRQHEPIHMWDAFNGELRCTYRGYDEVDEVEAAISVIFSSSGEKIYGGYKKSIKVFDTNIPGRASNSISVKQPISCFALNDSHEDTITSGSWNGYINHYDLRVPKLGPLFTLGGHSGGVTWMRYASTGEDNSFLFSGARKDSKILQWDMRNYTEPVQTFIRNVDTNQRIYFDLSPQCEWLVSGDTSGQIRIWDLFGETESIEVQLHQDCCNGVNLHPTLPILATTSGQYHFVDVIDDDDEGSKKISKNVTNSSKSDKVTRVDYENALLFLWFGENHAATAAASDETH